MNKKTRDPVYRGVDDGLRKSVSPIYSWTTEMIGAKLIHMTNFSYLKKSWWSPFLTAALIGGLFFYLLPSIALLALNSRSLMLGLIALGCIGFPWIIGRFHEISPVQPALVFYFVMATSCLLRPTSFDGNDKLALATYLVPWIGAALVVSAATCSFILRKKRPA